MKAPEQQVSKASSFAALKPANDEPTRWLNETQAARRLNMSVKWLQKCRLTGTESAPRFAKFGSSVRYSVADLEQFERASLRTSTSDDGRGNR